MKHYILLLAIQMSLNAKNAAGRSFEDFSRLNDQNTGKHSYGIFYLKQLLNDSILKQKIVIIKTDLFLLIIVLLLNDI